MHPSVSSVLSVVPFALRLPRRVRGLGSEYVGGETGFDNEADLSVLRALRGRIGQDGQVHLLDVANDPGSPYDSPRYGLNHLTTVAAIRAWTSRLNHSSCR